MPASYPTIVRLLLIFSFAAALAAQTSDERRLAHPRVFALADLARAAPPEFAARGLLQLLEAGAVPTREWQLELAHEALTLAASARHPLPKRLAHGIVAMDNRAMLWNVAYQQGLDKLTLSLRAIEQLRRLDPAAARKALAQLPRPATATVTCKDALIDDVSQWYVTAGRVNAEPGTILSAIQSAQSHAEIAPAIDLIFFRRGSSEELDLYAGAIGEKLRSLPATDRDFNAALFQAPKKIEHLLSTLKLLERPTAVLADGWRAWMQTGLAAPACAESRSAGPQEQARYDAFTLFNKSQAPLEPELLKPAGEAIAADLHPFAESEAIRSQTKLFHQLLFGSHSRGLSAAEKDTPEWREQMQTYIQSIEGRTRASDESDIEFFYRQSQLWSGVLMASPAGPTRDRALAQYLSFLLANAAHIDPLLWFSQLEGMAELTRSLHGNEFPKLLRSLHLTAHPVLQLYAELEADFPTRPSPKVN
jgi:hypothetical protein